MPKVSEVIEMLQQHYNPDDTVAYALWEIDDVKQVAKESGQAVTDKEAANILEIAHQSQDAGSGINWGFIEFTLENYFNPET